MKSYIVKDKEFRIIPKDVKGSTICVVEDAVDDYFSIQLKTHEDYSVNEPVELFSNTPQGLLYFKSCIKEVDKDLV